MGRLLGSTTAEKVALNVRREGECLRWLGAHVATGYGHLRVSGKTQRVHRVAYALAHGEVPPNLDIDHLCGVRDCIRVDHLEAVTHAENLRRSNNPVLRQRAECSHGHAYSEANTYTDPSGNRRCRTCRRDKKRAWVAQRKAALAATKEGR